MRVLIINGSHRRGNCFRFAEEANEILKKKHDVNIFNLIEMNIKDCTGCLACEEGEDCPVCDDFSNLIEPVLKHADLLIIATPTYFNMPSAATVKFINRTNKLCEFFGENQKKCLYYLVGQTDRDTIMEAYNCLHSYGEIMNMKEIAQPIIHVARMVESVPDDAINTLNNI